MNGLDKNKIWLRKQAEPIEADDLDYQDALLEARLRHFLHSEFGGAAPPPNVFARVLAAIRTDLPAKSNYRPRLSFTFAQLVRSMGGVLTGQAATRIVPTGVALL